MVLKCQSCGIIREEKDIETLEYALSDTCHRFYHYCADRINCKTRAELCAEHKII